MKSHASVWSFRPWNCTYRSLALPVYWDWNFCDSQIYVIILRVDHSNYFWLFTSQSTAARSVALVISNWKTGFRVNVKIMSDGPSPFRINTFCIFSKRLRVLHHFTLSYILLSNDGIEPFENEIRRMSQAVLQELRFNHSEWPNLLTIRICHTDWVDTVVLSRNYWGRGMSYNPD